MGGLNLTPGGHLIQPLTNLFPLCSCRYAIGAAERPLDLNNVGWLDRLAVDMGEPYVKINNTVTGGPSIKVNNRYLCSLSGYLLANFTTLAAKYTLRLLAPNNLLVLLHFCSFFLFSACLTIVSLRHGTVLHIYIVDIGGFWQCGANHRRRENFYHMCDVSWM